MDLDNFVVTECIVTMSEIDRNVSGSVLSGYSHLEVERDSAVPRG